MSITDVDDLSPLEGDVSKHEESVAATPGPEHLNEIRLCGRLAAVPEEKVLPSGDALVTFRLVVTRLPNRQRAGGRAVAVDTIDCTAWSAALRKRVARWERGDLVSVEGALRRRFWHANGGARSRYDVEVRRASRQRRAG